MKNKTAAFSFIVVHRTYYGGAYRKNGIRWVEGDLSTGKDLQQPNSGNEHLQQLHFSSENALAFHSERSQINDLPQRCFWPRKRHVWTCTRPKPISKSVRDPLKRSKCLPLALAQPAPIQHSQPTPPCFNTGRRRQ